MKRFCHIGFQGLAIIKANPLKTVSNYNVPRIAQIFGIEISKNESQLEFAQRYLKRLSSTQNLQQIINTQRLVQANKQLKIVEFTKQSISKMYNQMTKQAQISIDAFFLLLTKTFCEYTLKNRLNTKQIGINQSLIDILTAINQIFPLITLSKRNVIQYLRTLSHAKRLTRFFQNADLFSNIRLSLDTLMSIPISQFTQLQLINIFRNISNINVHNVYFEKSMEVVNYFWSGVSPLWITNQKTRLNLAISMNVLSCFSQAYANQVQQLLFNWKQYNLNLENRLFLLTTLIKLCKLYSQRSKKYDQLICKLVKQFKSNNMLNSLFSKSFLFFYRSGIWIPEYWIQLFQFIKQDKNKYIQYYHLYVISRLLQLEKDTIPIQIREKGKFIQDLVNKNFSKDEMLKDYQEKQINDKGLSCQIQIANSLRIINIGNVRTQCPIDFFVVDIFVNGKYVIQVNGGTHYLYNMQSKKKEYNLKTKFRSRLLKKLGYIVIEVDLQDYSQSSFSIVSQIYDIVKKGATEEKDLQLFK